MEAHAVQRIFNLSWEILESECNLCSFVQPEFSLAQNRGYEAHTCLVLCLSGGSMPKTDQKQLTEEKEK